MRLLKKDGTDRVRGRYDRISPYYDLIELLLEKAVFRRWRKMVFDSSDGDRILEVGVGTGKNFDFYPHGKRITAIGVNGYPIPFYGGSHVAADARRGLYFLPRHSRKGRCARDDEDGHTDGHPIQGPHGWGEHVHEGKEEEHHYTDELIKRAITQGLGPHGEPLDWTMPRWQMTEGDLIAIIEYVKTLE